MEIRTIVVLLAIANNVFDAYILNVIMSCLCKKRRVTRVIAIIFCVIIGACITICNLLVSKGVLSVFLSICQLCILLFVCYKDIKGAIITLSLGLTILSICEALTVVIISQITKIQMSPLVLDDSVQLAIIGFFTLILKYVTVYCLFFYNKKGTIDKKLEFNHALLFFISFFIMINVLILYNGILREEPVTYFFVFYFAICMIVFFIAMFWVYYKLIELLQEKERINTLEATIKIQEDYAEVIKITIEQLETMLHNTANSLQTIQNSFEEKLIVESTLTDLTDYYQKLAYKHSQIKTGFIKNYQLSSLFVLQKIQEADDKEIIFNCSLPLVFGIEMEEMDLYNILSNLLNNAFEAVEKLTDKRVITFRIYAQERFCFIEVENYYNGRSLTDGVNFFTTKEDKLYHGFGLKGVRKLAEKYHGELQIYSTEKSFKTLVMIPK